MKAREVALEDLIHLRGSADDAVRRLLAFDWDVDPDLVTLSPATVAEVLEKGAQEMNAAETMRRLARAAQTGDSDAYWSLHTDNFVAHIPGQSRVGGDHRGRSALEALDDLEKDLTEGNIEHEVHDTLLSRDHAVPDSHPPDSFQL